MTDEQFDRWKEHSREFFSDKHVDISLKYQKARSLSSVREPVSKDGVIDTVMKAKTGKDLGLGGIPPYTL